MPLDWIFGRKKSEPELVNQDGSPLKRDDVEDEFVMLPKSQESQATSDSGGAPLPYSLAPVSSSVVQKKQQQEPSHQQQSFLHGVPFKLANKGSFEDVDSMTTLHMRASQHLQFIKQLLSSNSLEYTFSLEDGVVRQ